MNCILLKRENLDPNTLGVMTHKDEGREQRIYLQGEEHDRWPANHQKLRKDMQPLLPHRYRKEPTLTMA